MPPVHRPTPAEASPSPKPGWLSDDARFWPICTLLLGAFAVLKGLRWPGEWALTQSQLDYSHGLVKRGLLGSVYTVLHLHHRAPLSGIFFAELAIFFILIIALTRQCGLPARFGTAAVAAAFASSYAVTYLTHLAGYIDIPNATLAFSLIGLRDPRRRFLLGLLVVPVAMLIHESFLLLFLPFVLFSFVLDGVTDADNKSLRYAWILGSIAVLLALALSLRANLTEPVLDQFQQEVEARVDFPLRDDVFLTLHRSLLGNMHDVLVVMKQQQWWANLLASAFALLPLLLLALRWMGQLLTAFGRIYGSNRERQVKAAAWIATFAPLVIYVIGWDCARWNVLCVLSAYLTLLLLSRKLPGVVIPFSHWDRNAVILVLAVNMASGFGFFDNFQAQPYPFFPALLQHTR